MPIDPSIPLAVKPPQPFDVIKTLGEVQQLKHGQQAMDMNALTIKEKRRTLDQQGLQDADDAAIRAEVQNQANSEDPHNFDAIADRLDKGGHVNAAMKVRKEVADKRRQDASDAHQQLANMEAANKIQAGLLGSVHDEPTWQSARAMMRATIEKTGDPKALEAFDAQAPKQYDPKWVESSLTALTDHATQVRERRNSVLEHQWAMEHGQPDENGNYDPKALDVWTSSAGRVLSQAKTPQQWDATMKALKQQGAPDAVLNRFDAVFSKDSAKKAGDITMSPQQLRQLGISATNASTAQGRAKTAADDLAWRRSHPTASQEDPNHANDMQEYNAYVRNHHASQAAKQKAFSQRMFSPDADPDEEPPDYEDPQDFQTWRAQNGHPPPAPGAPPAAPVSSAQPPAPAAPVPAAGAPPAATTPPAAAPARPAPAAQPSANSISVDPTNLKVTMPGVNGQPGKVLKFKDKQSMEAALKEAGYVTTPAKPGTNQK